MADYCVFLELLRKDHNRIATLFTQLLATEAGDKKRRDLFGELRREITLHSMLEDEMVYSRMKRRPELRMLTAASTSQHASADRLLTLLEKEPTTSPTWLKTLRQLHENLTEHMQIEERELRAVLPRLFTAQEVSALTVRLRAIRAA